MQLAAFNNNNFTLGHASMTINEGLPMYMVARLEREYDIANMTVGILGMAFKAESDDTRSSLSYKLKRLLRFRAARVLMHRSVRLERRRALAARRRARRVGPARHRDAAQRRTRSSTSTFRSSTSGTCSATASTCDRADIGRHPRLQRGRSDRHVPRSVDRGHHVAVRDPRRLRLARRHDARARGEVRARRPAGRPDAEHLRTRSGAARSASASTPRAATSSSSRWPTAPTTRARSTSSRGSSGAVS